MAYNGSGLFSLPLPPVVSGTVISSVWANTTLSNIATGLSTAICKDGQQIVTQDIPFATHKLRQVAQGIAVTDAPNVAQVQNSSLLYLNNVAGTNTITADFYGSVTPAAYVVGQVFYLIPANTNTGATTLAPGTLAAKDVYSSGAACIGGELVANSPVAVLYDGTRFNVLNVGLVASEIAVTNLDSDVLIGISAGAALVNGYLEATVSGNAITVSVLATGGSAPTAGNPVTTSLSDVTQTVSPRVSYSITSALSMTISSGSTMGCTTSETVRIHVGLMRNAGSGVELFCFTAATLASSYVFCPDPTQLVSTTAEGGAGGADSAQTLYSTTARTSQPWRYLGYFEIQSGATAGQWGNNPTKIVNFIAGMPLPGQIVATVRTDLGTVATGTTTMPAATTPAITDGTQFLTQAITVKSGLNWLHPYVRACVSSSNSTTAINCALFRTTVTNALVAASTPPRETTNAYFEMELDTYVKAPSLTTVTCTFRAGISAAATTTFNGVTGVETYGGVNNSYIQIEEIHA